MQTGGNMNRSERPFIFNHMEISLDGKIMGKYLWIPETNTESDPFYRTIFGPDAKFTFQAIVEGRTTIEDNETGYAVPEVDENAAPVPEGDYLAPGASCGRFQFVLDSKGRVAWTKNTTDFGEEKAHIVEVMSHRASNAYRDYLRRQGISYILCGDDHVDLEEFCRKAKSLFHVDSMMLGGGGTVNWSFIQAGLTDEMSLILAPAADGNVNTQSLFMARPGISEDHPVLFRPLDVQLLDDGFVWLHYAVGKKNMYDFDNDPEFKAVQEVIARGRNE